MWRKFDWVLVTFLSSWLVLYISIWQHPAATPSALIPTLKLLYPFPIPLATGNHTSPYHSAVQPLNPIFQLHATSSPFPTPKGPLLFFSTYSCHLSLLYHFTQPNSSYIILPTFLPSASKPVLFISSLLPHSLMQNCWYWAGPLPHGVLLIFVGVSSHRTWEGKLQIQE